MLTMLKRLWSEERGQGMTEYGLILALIVIGVITILVTMGDKLVEKFTAISTGLDDPTP
ncbi:Flp family type IVb pilin [Phosphitispora sp. TUW77]|uniref:Flp family type IVb pilin n=1 Tax=Phosphitispora sp. TUW77 TaxID=3152361 RepID=UPI003AB1B706